MARTKFTTDGNGVTISYDCAYTGQRIERSFFTGSAKNAYVREWLPNGDARQVCENLGTSGSTLMLYGPMDLPTLIRREYRAMRAAERREEARKYR